MKNTWGSRIMIIPLVGGFLLASSGFGVTMVAAAPPATQSDLQGVTQNWDKNLPSASRFTILKDFNNKAVRDNNTGLVWEQSPDTTTRDWLHARLDCLNKNVGGTTGWRLPSVAELNSVRDPSLAAVCPGRRLYRHPIGRVLISDDGCRASRLCVVRGLHHRLLGPQL